jgi:hypothetical protein
MHIGADDGDKHAQRDMCVEFKAHNYRQLILLVILVSGLLFVHSARTAMAGAPRAH